MPSAHANNIDIEYESFGDPSSPPMLLIMGLAVQMVAWPDGFCRMLADRGFHVVRFDNRDIGRSSMIEGGPEPNIFAAMTGDTSTASYTLEDMADDAAGLLDALGIPAAHVVGASMGGMIAQTLAIRHPGRVLSLTSIMSTTGDPTVGQSKPEAMVALLTPPPTTREEAVERGVRIFRTIGSEAELFDEAFVREMAGVSWDRNPSHEGVPRQLLAIVASGDRTERLRRLSIPALVIHGERDPLVTPSGGEATAAAIPGARLITVARMGHDLPRQLWPRFVDAIAANAARAASKESSPAVPSHE